MKPDYKEPGNGRLSGVYRIVNLINQRVYYGSTLSFRKRYMGHRNSLENNKHANRFLQADYNKTGAEHFIFEVVEIVSGSKEDLYKEEQKYLDKFYDSGKQCYNLRSVASVSRAGCADIQSNDKIAAAKQYQTTTEETKQKRKAALRRYYAEEFDDEAKARKRASIQKYYAEEYDEEAQRARNANVQKFYEENSKFNGLVLTHMETGEQVEVKGSLRTFCKDRGLSYKAFHQLVVWKIKSSSGWFVGTEKPAYVERKGEKRKPLSKEHREKIAKGKYEGIVLVNDRGETLTLARNVKEQARELGLYYTTLLKVIHRETKSVGGWKLPPSHLPSTHHQSSEVFPD